MPEVPAADQFAALLEDVPPERQQQVRDALYDLSCGYKFWAGDDTNRKPPYSARNKYRVVRTDTETGEQVEGWIYEMPPDARALQILVEQRAGKPQMREHAQRDMTVFIAHRLPGRREYVPDDLPEIEETPEGAVETAGGGWIGVGAVMGPDDPGDDEA